MRESLQRNHSLYDRAGDQHYQCISALIKSMRRGDANASLYWLVRMLAGGEDPLFIARRVVIFASEDIGKLGRTDNGGGGKFDGSAHHLFFFSTGLADAGALSLAVATCHLIGLPECEVSKCRGFVACGWGAYTIIWEFLESVNFHAKLLSNNSLDSDASYKEYIQRSISRKHFWALRQT